MTEKINGKVFEDEDVEDGEPRCNECGEPAKVKCKHCEAWSCGCTGGCPWCGETLEDQD